MRDNTTNQREVSTVEPTNQEYEYTFDPIHDLVERWEITQESAEVFLERVGYFDTSRYHEIAEYFEPTLSEEGSR